MAVLIEKEIRRRPCAANEMRGSSDLTPQEQANVRLALRFLRIRLGGSIRLANALKVRPNVIEKACAVRGRPGAGLAIRGARVAGVSVESVLAGA